MANNCDNCKNQNRVKGNACLENRIDKCFGDPGAMPDGNLRTGGIGTGGEHEAEEAKKAHKRLKNLPKRIKDLTATLTSTEEVYTGAIFWSLGCSVCKWQGHCSVCISEHPDCPSCGGTGVSREILRQTF